MPYSCIFCEAVPEELSKEHLIPSCIRGRLNSSRLICQTCNNKFGTELDIVLRDRFELIEGFLSLKKDDRKKFKANLKFKDRAVILTPTGIKFKHPHVIGKSKNGVQMAFPSEKSLRKHYNKMKKKYPDIDIEKIIQESKIEYIPFDQPLDFTSEGPINLTWRACGKIVYEYLFLIKENIVISNKNFKESILNGEKPDDLLLCLKYNYKPILRNPNHIYHTIIIKAMENENLLIGYLELYSSLKIFMVIDVKYQGPPFSNGYYLDLMTEEQFTFTPKKKLPFSREELLSFIENFDLEKEGYEYMQEFMKASSKARLFPMIQKLNSINQKLNETKFEKKINKLSFVYLNLIEELGRLGLETLEKKINDNESIYFSEIITKLSRLTGTFLEWDMDCSIINEIYKKII